MGFHKPSLFIEIGKLEFVFVVLKENENNSTEVVYKNSIPLEGFTKNRISDFDLVCKIIKKNIFLIEQKTSFIFKEVNIVLNNFESSLVTFSGFKKLNGSQLLKENITYILNSLKSKIDEIEKDKKILHIFNSKYLLDNKKVENIPIGLFGNFYCHELSFFLINTNDFKNLRSIFNNCNLKINKIISKNFIDGVNLINKNLNLDTFFEIKINRQNSQIIFFENSALKFIEDFNFGSEILINDISKVIGLKVSNIKTILLDSKFKGVNLENEYLEKEFFKGQNFRKIRKKLFFDIAKSRIQELSELILTKNINVKSFLQNKVSIFIYFDEKVSTQVFEEFFKKFFSVNYKYELTVLENLSKNDTYDSANKLVQFGWKQEAVPVIQEKKSIISRFFEFFFK